MTGVSSPTVIRWLRDEYTPSPDNCALIAEALKLHLDVVLAWAGHRQDPELIQRLEFEEFLSEAERRFGQGFGPPGPGLSAVRRIHPSDPYGMGGTMTVPTDYLTGIMAPAAWLVPDDALAAHGLQRGDVALIDCDKEPQPGDVALVPTAGEAQLVVWNGQHALPEARRPIGKVVKRLLLRDMGGPQS